jgi:hypothetical protein
LHDFKQELLAVEVPEEGGDWGISAEERFQRVFPRA